ncbi:MAG: hypothetical protein ACRCWC_03830 [Plesiomonas shigelloides]
MTGAELWIWLASNPWRTAALGLIVALLVSGVTIKILVMSRELLKSELKLERAKVERIKKLGEEQQAKMEEANKQLADLLKKQEENKMKIAKLLKDWPEDCETAAARALEIAKRTRK